MAYSTQRKFFLVPFKNQKMQLECQDKTGCLKSYKKCVDDRCWSTDSELQSNFLVDLIACRSPVGQRRGDPTGCKKKEPPRGKFRNSDRSGSSDRSRSSSISGRSSRSRNSSSDDDDHNDRRYGGRDRPTTNQFSNSDLSDNDTDINSYSNTDTVSSDNTCFEEEQDTIKYKKKGDVVCKTKKSEQTINSQLNVNRNENNRNGNNLIEYILKIIQQTYRYISTLNFRNNRLF